jgi:hypothetical protein
MVRKLYHSPHRSLRRAYLRRRKKLLFKINKIRNITIEKGSDQCRREDGHWPSLARGGVDRGNGRHNTFEGGRMWPELLHMAKKHIIIIIIIKKKKKKEEEEE